MKNTKLLSCAAVLAALTASQTVHAFTTNIVCSTSDYTCQAAANVNNSDNSTTDAIGFAGNTSAWAAILMFPLPTLPAGTVVGDQTSLTITLASVGGSTTINGDLWGVANFRTNIPAFNTTPDSSYYYYLRSDTGPGSNSTATDTKILDNYLNTTMIGKPANFAVATSFGATNTLAQYIQGFYNANPTYNASNGVAYVWLRINPDANSTSTANRYVINAGEGSTGKPTLTVEFKVPTVLPLTWNGNLSSLWDIGTANWKSNGVSGFAYADGVDVLFDSTFTGSPAVTLNTTVQPKSTTFNSSSNYIISGTGKISGTNTITKLGAGTTIFDTDNDYSGGTSLAAGTLQIGNNDAHGSLGSGNIAISGASTTLAYNRTDSSSVNTVYYNNGTPNIMVNSGTLHLQGASDNIGATATVNSGGTLVLDKPSNSGVHALGGTSIINAGGTLRLGGTGGDQIYKNVIISNYGVFDMAGLNESFNGLGGNGAVTNSVAAESMLSLGEGGGSAVFTGPIVNGAGTVDVVKIGAGTQTIAGPNTYTGSTTVTTGTLVTTTASAGAGAYTVSDSAGLEVGVLTPNGVLNMSSLSLGYTTLTFDGINSTTTAPINTGSLSQSDLCFININSGTFAPGQNYPLVSFAPSGGSSFVLGTLPPGVFGNLDTSASPVTLQITGVPVTWNGNVSSNWDINSTPNWKAGNVTGLDYFDNGVVTFDDTATNNGSVNITTGVSPYSVTVTNNTKTYFFGGSGAINGSTLLTKSGSGTLILDTDNTYTGGTVLSGGTIQVGNNDAHGSIGTGAFTNLVPGSILAFNRTDAINVGTITRTTVDNSAQIVVNSGTVNLVGTADNAGTLATVNSGGTLVLAKTSSSVTHALSGPSLLINPGGALVLGGSGNDQIYTASGLVDNGVFNLAGTSEGFDVLNGSGSVTTTGTSMLTLGENNGTSTFGGAIGNGAGTMALTKSGSGTLTLTGTNTYTGTTTVSAGTLVTSTASTGSGAYSVANGAALGVKVAAANGSLGVGALTLGSSAATSLSFQSLNSTSAAAIAASSVAVNGAVTVNITSGTFTSGTDYPLLSYSSRSGSGSFTLGTLPSGVSATLNSASSPVTLHVNTVVNLTPTNILASVTGGNLTLQWPSDHTGWTLQSNSISLAGQSNWFNVAGSSTTNSLTFAVPTNVPQVFYRLKY